jgi:hypothetical protein
VQFDLPVLPKSFPYFGQHELSKPVVGGGGEGGGVGPGGGEPVPKNAIRLWFELSETMIF